ncbi:PAS domain S-box protein [Methanospirillum hungatei]|uniref:sensor histidine kinase n=1 Tax=Methanospirillum hungatei TaxID=2203 RepID=UPI0026EC1FF3|nr:PAS domain S-box protein [Methanospirillum hungatei]MCA1915160.1 PAS domain S-box protein [Methanospirillum hungatei]
MQKEKIEILRNTLQNVKKPLSIAEISRLSELSRITTARYLDQMYLSGQVKMFEIGKAKKFIMSSEQYTHNLYDLSTNFVLILDQNLRVVFINESYLKKIKIFKDNIIGKRIQSLNLDIFSSPEILSLLHKFRGEGVAQHHVTIEINDASHVYSVIIAKISFLTNFLATAIIAQDITEKYKSDEKLHFLASMVSSSEDAIIGIDLHGIIRSWNDGAHKIFGYKNDDVIGKSISLIFPPEKEEEYLDLLYKVMAGKLSVLKGTYLLSRNNVDTDISYTISPVTDDNGNIIGLSIIIRDITDLNTIQKALMVSKKKIKILSGITRHDILNQLQALDAFSDLIKPSLVKEPQALEYLRHISTCSNKIRQQIQFTREYEEIGDSVPIWQPLDMVVKAAAIDFLPETIVLNLEITDYELFADPMLMLVFYNLMDNSIRHGIHVTKINISLVEDVSGMAVLVYEDNGIGIPDLLKNQIFEKGYGKNNGLGLFLVREILEITGFEIKETGRENVGARFEITIPARAFRKNRT